MNPLRVTALDADEPISEVRTRTRTRTRTPARTTATAQDNVDGLSPTMPAFRVTHAARTSGAAPAARARHASHRGHMSPQRLRPMVAHAIAAVALATMVAVAWAVVRDFHHHLSSAPGNSSQLPDPK